MSQPNETPAPRVQLLARTRRIAPMATAVVALVSLAGLGWAGLGTRDQMQVAMQKAVRVAELRGEFTYLDEWLTMSGQMAAVTGEARWMSRYDEARPKLDAALAEAASLATPQVSAALQETTDEASRGLVAMSRAAFTLAASGNRSAARSLLDSSDFEYLRSVYASGIEAFGEDVKSLTAMRSRIITDRAWMEAGGLALGAIFLASALTGLRGHRRLRAALACTEAAARTDPLTGLPNRRHLQEHLQVLTGTAAGRLGGVALLVLGLDRFKLVNDVQGHGAGDQVLKLVAARLRAAARKGDFVARLGGDEFALATPIAVPGQEGLTLAGTEYLAHRIIAALDQPFHLASGFAVQVGASVGLAASQEEDAPAEALVRRADVALSLAKAAGRGRCSLYDPTLDRQILSRAQLEVELRQAIADEAIVPYFQPLVSIASGRTVGFEMLARWPHPIRGMVPPAEFIPIAEESGLIGAMTESLLRRACVIAASWPSDVTVACNVSPLQLRDHTLPAMVRAALDHSGLPAHRLELEVTESALVGDLDLARELLTELKAVGVSLALDDFGTGYSSLRHLQVLPFDKLKIDASFVGAMTADPESRKIVAAVIGLGNSLGLLTVAEGVEQPDKAAMLADLGCDIGQGWLYGRPGPDTAAYERVGQRDAVIA